MSNGMTPEPIMLAEADCGVNEHGICSGCGVGSVDLCPDCKEGFAFDALCAEIHAWRLETFPNATHASHVEHLRREVEELAENPTPGEIADCVLLLIGIAGIHGFSITQAVIDKFEINKKRQWGKPDAQGVVEHVRSAPPPEDDEYDEYAEWLSRLPSNAALTPSDPEEES